MIPFLFSDEEKKKSIVIEELKLTETGFRINPKSYCSWFHRCWVLDNFGTKEDWTKELYICTKYLEMDERNCNYFLYSRMMNVYLLNFCLGNNIYFILTVHCWDYRKYVVERLNTQLEKELDFSLQKLSANFSNYSAWHYRSKLIPRIHSIFDQKKLFESDVYEQGMFNFSLLSYLDVKRCK